MDEEYFSKLLENYYNTDPLAPSTSGKILCYFVAMEIVSKNAKFGIKKTEFFDFLLVYRYVFYDGK